MTSETNKQHKRPFSNGGRDAGAAGVGPASVGAVGFGAMSFGGFYGKSDEATSHAALVACLDTGTTHWDTANVYGPDTSELYIGSFLAANPGVRDKIHLATKGSIRVNDGGEREFDNSRKHLTEALDASLTRLGVDHVELYYIHRRDPRVPIEDMMDTLTNFVAQGKIGAIGLSEVSPDTITKASKFGKISAVQSEYSLWTREPERGVISLCKDLGITFVAFSPLGRGILGGGLTSVDELASNDFRRQNPRYIEPNFSNNLAALVPLSTFAKARSMTMAQVAISWTLSKGDHIIPIPGTRYANRVRENAGSLVLSSEDLDELETLFPLGFAHGERYAQAQAVGPETY